MIISLFILLVVINIGLVGWIVYNKYKNKYDIKNNIDGINTVNEEKDMRGIQEFISDSNKKDKDNLSELVRMMKESKDEENSKKRDQELVEYVKSKIKDMPPGSIKIGTGNDKLIDKNDGDLIPFNLNNIDKELLKEFYNSWYLLYE